MSDEKSAVYGGGSADKGVLQELRGQSAELHWLPVDPGVNNARNKEGAAFLRACTRFSGLLTHSESSLGSSISSLIIFTLAGATKPSLT